MSQINVQCWNATERSAWEVLFVDGETAATQEMPCCAANDDVCKIPFGQGAQGSPTTLFHADIQKLLQARMGLDSAEIQNVCFDHRVEWRVVELERRMRVLTSDLANLGDRRNRLDHRLDVLERRQDRRYSMAEPLVNGVIDLVHHRLPPPPPPAAPALDRRLDLVEGAMRWRENEIWGLERDFGRLDDRTRVLEPGRQGWGFEDRGNWVFDTRSMGIEARLNHMEGLIQRMEWRVQSMQRLAGNLDERVGRLELFV